MQFTLEKLRNLPTLAAGQADNLKIDNGQTRVWLCRCGVEDGMSYDNAVTVERLENGKWQQVDQFEAVPGKLYAIVE